MKSHFLSRHALRAWCFALSAAVVAACGGGGGGSTDAPAYRQMSDEIDRRIKALALFR